QSSAIALANAAPPGRSPKECAPSWRSRSSAAVLPHSEQFKGGDGVQFGHSAIIGGWPAKERGGSCGGRHGENRWGIATGAPLCPFVRGAVKRPARRCLRYVCGARH